MTDGNDSVDIKNKKNLVLLYSTVLFIVIFIASFLFPIFSKNLFQYDLDNTTSLLQEALELKLANTASVLQKPQFKQQISDSLKWDPFNALSITKKAKHQATKNITGSNMKRPPLTLKAIFLNAIPLALIQIGDEPGQIYKIGDTLSGRRILSINKVHVLVTDGITKTSLVPKEKP